jgi:hypothetical protein
MLTAQAAGPPQAVPLVPFDRQPRIGPAIGRRFAQVAESPLVTPNLNADRLYRMGKLQTWTLAPAASSVRHSTQRAANHFAA